MRRFHVRFAYRHWSSGTLCCSVLLFSMLLCGGCNILSAPTPSHRARTADAWVAVGMAYLDQQDTVGARRAFERARRFDDSRPGVWHGLARCAQSEHNSAQAHTLYRQAMALAERADTMEDSEHAALLINHAQLLYDEGAIRDACIERERAAQYAHGPGSDRHASLMHCP